LPGANTSLFGLVVSNEEKKFYKIDTRLTMTTQTEQRIRISFFIVDLILGYFRSGASGFRPGNEVTAGAETGKPYIPS
jgi:hypothetical protein